MEAGGIGKGVRQMKPRKVICPNCGKKLISNFSLVEIKAGGRKYYVHLDPTRPLQFGINIIIYAITH